MNIGIVGHAADKFTPRTAREAKRIIREILAPAGSVLVSGRCPLGGIDVWAERIAQQMHRYDPHLIFAPRTHDWATGYRPRNIQIADSADIVYCLVVQDYPLTYTGRRFSQCYHCRDARPRHVKSGGCWTANRADRAEWIIIK